MQENWHIVDNNCNKDINDRLSEGPPCSLICYEEKELFSWQAWLSLATQHPPSSSPAALSGDGYWSPAPSQPHSAPTKLLVLSLSSDTWQKNRCKHSWDGGDGLGVVFPQFLSLFPTQERRGSIGLVRWVRVEHTWPWGWRARSTLWGWGWGLSLPLLLSW